MKDIPNLIQHPWRPRSVIIRINGVNINYWADEKRQISGVDCSCCPYEFAEKKVLYIQPKKDVREEGIKSRIGINTRAERVKSLSQVKNGVDVIGIDEVHMFPITDAEYIAKWLSEGKQVFVTGLDLDYSGRLQPMIARIMELKPHNIIVKKSRLRSLP